MQRQEPEKNDKQKEKKSDIYTFFINGKKVPVVAAQPTQENNTTVKNSK